MKKLTCEMCGSTDIIKQDGVFVCQVCGCKYSVEEAKKMMVEGTVEVTGTVSIDNSEKLKNLYVLARRAKDEDNYEKGAKYYGELAVSNPNDWESAFYSTYYNTLNKCKIRDIESASQIIKKCFLSTVVLIKSNVPFEQQKDSFAEIAGKCVYTATLFFNNAVQTLNDNLSYNNCILDFDSRAAASVDLISAVAKAALEDFDEIPLAKSIYELGIHLCDSCFYSKNKNYKAAIMLDYTATSLKELEAVAKKKEEEFKKANEQREKYWSAHYEEKVALESEKEELQKQVKHINAQILEADAGKSSSIAETEKEERTKLHNKIKDLNNEYKNLGLFSGKRKKEIQAQLNEAESRVNEIEKEIAAMVAERDAKIKAETDALREQMKPLYARMAEIDAELTRDR